jgi:3-polyprenyl-4-hydroxybenzoate decarboxylase
LLLELLLVKSAAHKVTVAFSSLFEASFSSTGVELEVELVEEAMEVVAGVAVEVEDEIEIKSEAEAEVDAEAEVAQIAVDFDKSVTSGSFAANSRYIAPRLSS